MAEMGANVVRASRSGTAETLDRIAAMGGRARELSLDLASPVPDPFTQSGPVDILVNNPNVFRRADAIDFTKTDWDAVMDVNLKATFFLCQAFARAALARNAGGAIVNIASLLSLQGGIRVASYTASKQGVAGLTKLLANKWVAWSINVNAIAPGYIETKNTNALRADPVRAKSILDLIPAGRWRMPEDIVGGGGVSGVTGRSPRAGDGADRRWRLDGGVGC